MRDSSQPSWPAAILAVIFAACVSANIGAQDTKAAKSLKPSFSLTIGAKEAAVKAGLPIWVDVMMENKTDHDLRVYRALSGDMDQGGWVYVVDVRDDKGAAPPRTQYARSIGAGGSGGYLPLDPGKTLTDRVSVSKLYDLSRPGKYAIQFRRVDEESKTFVKSNKITVTVAP